MLFLIAKYLSSSSSRRRGSSKHTAAAPGENNREMPAAAAVEREREQGCMAGCVPVAMRYKRTGASAKVVTVTASSARTSRHGFVRSAASGLFRDGAAARGRYFTNHESLPPLPEARAEFAAAFPQYSAGAGDGEEAAAAADAIRAREYPHLARHACLDYTGVNLFSHAQMDSSSSSLPSTSSSSPAPAPWQPPFFDVAYRSATLRSQVEQCDSGGIGGGIGRAVARRIMASMKMPEEEYVMVCAANRTSAFRLLAESYAFSSPNSGGRKKKKLLAVYDYESEAVGAMSAAARRRGAEVLHATFTWPGLRLHAADLRKKLLRRHQGLMVFPLVSRMTGARHPYLWMSAAAERGWHVALDASAMGAKDLDTLGLSLLRPDFVVCNFFKVFGENPSGFAGIFVKKASLAALVEDSPAAVARSIGVVSLVPPRRWSLRDDYSTDLDLSRSFTNPDPPPPQSAEIDITCSFSGPLSTAAAAATPEICEEEEAPAPPPPPPLPEAEEKEVAVELRGLDHADALGLIAIGNRLRCISNWLVIAMQKLKHPHPEDTAAIGGGGGQQLVRIYGPRVSFSRGPAVAFNVYDWKGEKVAPGMVQKLADRHAVSLTCGFLRNVSFADKYDADRTAVLERRRSNEGEEEVWGIHVVNASLGFLSSFEDAYRLWAFVANFLDADFVEKERWRYTALNQKTVEV